MQRAIRNRLRHPPTGPSVFGLTGESLEKCACAPFPARADPETVPKQRFDGESGESYLRAIFVRTPARLEDRDLRAFNPGYFRLVDVLPHELRPAFIKWCRRYGAETILPLRTPNRKLPTSP